MQWFKSEKESPPHKCYVLAFYPICEPHMEVILYDPDGDEFATWAGDYRPEFWTWLPNAPSENER